MCTYTSEFYSELAYELFRRRGLKLVNLCDWPHFSFLLLMSDGLYNSYKEATGSEQVNKEIAQMVVEQVSIY